MCEERETMTVEEAATISGLSRGMMRSMLKQGIPFGMAVLMGEEKHQKYRYVIFRQRFLKYINAEDLGIVQ